MEIRNILTIKSTGENENYCYKSNAIYDDKNAHSDLINCKGN